MEVMSNLFRYFLKKGYTPICPNLEYKTLLDNIEDLSDSVDFNINLIFLLISP